MWTRRTKRTTAVALGLVAVMAGIAVAYFLTSQKFAGNTAVGGQLTVDSSLPVDFTSEPLYPTAAATPDQTAVAKQDFDITNNNTVKVHYEIYATCAECIADPTDSPDQAAARADKANQFNNLYVKIYDPANACTLPSCVSGLNDQKEKVYYQGPLSGLTPDSAKSLDPAAGPITPGNSHTYHVDLWLANDAANAQPQAVQNSWEFFINAKTPVG
jgi:hypothetical protein